MSKIQETWNRYKHLDRMIVSLERIHNGVVSNMWEAIKEDLEYIRHLEMVAMAAEKVVDSHGFHGICDEDIELEKAVKALQILSK